MALVTCSFHRWTRRWRFICARTHVHRRDCPAKLRGRLVGFFQFNVVLGILVAYFSNYLISLQHLGLQNGAGTGVSLHFRLCSSCCLPFLAAHAGWSRNAVWTKPEACCGPPATKTTTLTYRKLLLPSIWSKVTGHREAVHPKICLSDLPGGQHLQCSPTVGD